MAEQIYTIYQPLHPKVRPKLDPEYVAFHDKYMQYVPRDESKVWDGSARTTPSLPPGGLEPVNVGLIQDIELQGFKLRVYMPKVDGTAKLPCLLWFHGGGWAIGGLDDGRDFCSLTCQEAKCVVVTVDYRLAPEHPYPAAIEDAVESLRWVVGPGAAQFNLDLDRIAIGGTSAGSNLSIVLCLKVAAELDVKISFQLLIVPVIDNTATIEGIWQQNCHAPWLTPARMTWYRQMYLPHEVDRQNWKASPNLASEELLRRLPPTWMAVSEQDLLAPEAHSFAKQLSSLNVPVTLYEVEGGTHSILALCGVLSKGKQMVMEAVRVLNSAFW